MKRKYLPLVAGGAFAMMCYGQGVSNPVLPNADPFITRRPVRGRYLLLATTGQNIVIWSGPTIPTVAQNPKVVFTPEDGLAELWSPTIWKMNGKWWIYFTARAPGKEHGIYALESDTSDALGRYGFRGQLDLGGPAIDPSVLVVSGRDYLMFVSLEGGQNAIKIAPLASPMQLGGNASLIAEPEFPWEKGAGSKHNYPVVEGPTALYHSGKIFIVYSGSDTASPVYCLGLLTFNGGNPLDRNNWKKSPDPVFAASAANGIYGPGRGTFAEAADGTEWLLYAAKSTDAASSEHRETRMQPFRWNPDGSPFFGVPLQDGPLQSK